MARFSFRERLKLAWQALLALPGYTCFGSIEAVPSGDTPRTDPLTIDIEVDTSQASAPIDSLKATIGGLFDAWEVSTASFERDLDRVKAKVDEFAAAARKATAPRLMIFSSRMLSCDAAQRLRERFNLAVEEGKSLVIEPGMTVYQIVDGRWTSVADGKDIEDPGTDEPEGYSDRMADLSERFKQILTGPRDPGEVFNEHGQPI